MLDYAQHALGVRMTTDLYAESVREGGGLMGFFKGGTKKKDDGDESPEDWHKRATLKAGYRLGAKPRTIAFHHDADIVCELAYDDVGSCRPARRRRSPCNIRHRRARPDMAKQNTTGQLPRPKVQLSFTLDASGIASLSKAEVSVVEYEVAAAAQGRLQGRGQRDGRERDRPNATDAEAANAAKDEEKPAEAAARRPPPTRRRRGRPEANAPDANATGAAPGKVLKKKTYKRTLTTPSTAGLRRAAALRRRRRVRPAGGDRRGREGAPRARGREERPRGGDLSRKRTLHDRAKRSSPCRRRSSARNRVDVARARRLALRGQLSRGDLQRQAHALRPWRPSSAARKSWPRGPRPSRSSARPSRWPRRTRFEVCPTSGFLEQEDLDALVKKADDAGAWLDDQEKAQKKSQEPRGAAWAAELNEAQADGRLAAPQREEKARRDRGQRDERDGRQRYRRQRHRRERDGAGAGRARRRVTEEMD